MKQRLFKMLTGLACACLLGAAACSKLLEEPSSPDTFTPATIEDFNNLLQNSLVMNKTSGLGDISADNYYLVYSFWQSLPWIQHQAHTWAEDIYGSNTQIEDWLGPYTQVMYANTILDKIDTAKGDSNAVKRTKGKALFFRAHAFYQLATLFAPGYDEAKAPQLPGIPLKLQAPIETGLKRASLAATFGRIENDLQLAIPLLGPHDAASTNLPGQPAAMALLARVYLYMGKYRQALTCAEQCLQTYDTLLDYNTLDSANNNPFKRPNPEILFYSECFTSATVLKGLVATGAIIDSALYRSYAANDLRRKLYFTTNAQTGLPINKCSYTGTIYPFTGIATDEVWLIKAECLARATRVKEAAAAIDSLRKRRWRKGFFIPTRETTQSGMINLVLQERRKELPFRGLRWSDLRRFDRDGVSVTLRRLLNGKPHELPPGDRRYTLPIPYDIIAMSGMEQNPR